MVGGGLKTPFLLANLEYSGIYINDCTGRKSSAQRRILLVQEYLLFVNFYQFNACAAFTFPYTNDMNFYNNCDFQGYMSDRWRS